MAAKTDTVLYVAIAKQIDDVEEKYSRCVDTLLLSNNHIERLSGFRQFRNARAISLASNEVRLSDTFGEGAPPRLMVQYVRRARCLCTGVGLRRVGQSIGTA